ncbi:unnamed protein product, partial [Iphiclides podalirius]
MNASAVSVALRVSPRLKVTGWRDPVSTGIDGCPKPPPNPDADCETIRRAFSMSRGPWRFPTGRRSSAGYSALS